MHERTFEYCPDKQKKYKATAKIGQVQQAISGQFLTILVFLTIFKISANLAIYVLFGYFCYFANICHFCHIVNFRQSVILTVFIEFLFQGYIWRSLESKMFSNRSRGSAQKSINGKRTGGLPNNCFARNQNPPKAQK